MLTKILPVKLADHEIAMKSRLLAQKLDERDDIDAQLVSFKATMKGKLEAIELEIQELRSVVRNGTEQRPVSCLEEKNFAKGVVEFLREDTMQVVDSRPMTAQEKQVTLPIPIDSAKKEPERPSLSDVSAPAEPKDDPSKLGAASDAVVPDDYVPEGAVPPKKACEGCGVVVGGANQHRSDCPNTTEAALASLDDDEPAAAAGDVPPQADDDDDFADTGEETLKHLAEFEKDDDDEKGAP